MNRKFINFLLKFGVIVAAYVVAAQYIDEQLILFVTIGISLTYIVYRYFSKKDPLDELKRYSNVPNYLRKTERAFSRNQTKQSVYMAYGKIYEGEIEESKAFLKNIDLQVLKESAETYHIYLQTILRHEYSEKNIDEIEEIFKIALTEQAIHPNTEKIAKLMILMIEEKHQEALKVLLDIIPKEDRRHVIMELEVMLAEVYIFLDQKEDARAVLKFVSSRKYHTVHVEMAKSMLVGLS
ncbi:MAG: tetratricopeptide repeat protein [Candidatus Izemoplasmataceae bacterium]